MTNTIDIFKTPIYKIKKNLNLDYYLNKSLSFKEKYPSRNKSNAGGYQSPDLIINEKIFQQNFFNDIREDLTNFYSIFNMNKEIQTKELWLNINKQHSFNKLHDHPFSFMSGVFYIKANKNNGKLIFHDNYSKNLYAENYHTSYISSYNEYNSSTHHIVPEENTLILFLSSTWHEVEPNLTNEERISLSFNLK